MRRTLATTVLGLSLGWLAPVGWVSAAPPRLAMAVMVETGFQMDVLSQSMRYEYEQWTLFDDGSVYKNLPSKALADFDTAASRKARPSAWGQWRRVGDKLEVRWPGAGSAKDATWSAPKRWFELTVAGDGDTLHAVYSVAGASAQRGLFETSFATGWKQITFHGDGRFEQVSGGSAAGSQGTGGNVLSTRTQSGQGRYRIQGPTLELQFDDGRRLRASLFFSSPDRKTLMLNGTRMRLNKRL